MDIIKILNHLKNDNKRDVFCSEADFQHAFAWAIHECYKDAEIRLEYTPPDITKKIAIDIWVVNEIKYAIELKYPTSKLHDNNGIKLKDQVAMDIRRYGFVKDIERLEKLREENIISKGYAILLTNNHLFWNGPKTSNKTIDENFRVHENCKLHGELNWTRESNWTKKGDWNRKIKLEREYLCKWSDYSEIKVEKNGKLRYLLVEV